MRLLVVSNRLPVTVQKTAEGVNFKESVGGLVSGLSAYLDSLRGHSNYEKEAQYVWIGWPGATIENNNQNSVKEKVLSEFNAYPVFLPEKVMDAFYLGFCNKTIWPLFHYFTNHVVFDEEYWNSYVDVNRMFCKTVLETARPDDVIWVQDYHLMLLPKLIRESMSDVSIGFFLHIPFPFFEIFRILPKKWSSNILEGLLGSDLVGFHTHNYAQYFLRCVLRILGIEHHMGKIILDDHIAEAKAFPMGIDFKKYINIVSEPTVFQQAKEIKEAVGNYKIIMSIDRLDYTKGICHRLEAFETFLEKNSNWNKKVVLVIVVVPSRIGVEHYQKMKKQIDELVGRVNGRFGSINWTPILYQYRFLPFCPLVALYNASDVALVTPLRDGMNLIAKEYIASKPDKKGILILSEMAGASKELAEAIIVNPNNKEEIVDALKEALEMPDEEQVRRNSIMQDRLSRHDVVRWAREFMEELRLIKDAQKKFYSRFLSPYVKDKLIDSFRSNKKRLVFLDYDGTLMPFASTPNGAKPTHELIDILKRLSLNLKNEVVIVSGRDKGTLMEWLGELPIGIIAEHGVWIKEKAMDFRLIKPLNNSWMPAIRQILEKFADSLPGSFVEQKEFSIVWHYRRVVDVEAASLLVKELMDTIISFAANMDIQVLPGNKVVEVRNTGINKGTAGLTWMSKGSYGFIIAMGDDWTDEDLFMVLPESAYSIKVGISRSYGSFAKYSIHDYRGALTLLAQLAEINDAIV